MHTISRFVIAASLLLMTVLLVACKKNEGTHVVKQVRVSATKAYKKYFGPAPTTDKGSCFAFVIYFPSAKNPGKVVPFPFFTFDKESIKKVAVERLLAGMDVPVYRSEILQAFDPGTHLLGLVEEKGVVMVNFSKELTNVSADNACERGVFDALALTLAQFEEVKEVHIEVEGKQGSISLPHGCLIRQPLLIDESAVLEPGPPRLLEIAVLKEKGANTIEEVHVYFDRPLDVKDLVLSDKNGKTFAGEMYSSVFDMAAVLKPKDPSLLTAGMKVRVRWKAVDKMGRTAQGEQEQPLIIKQH